MKIRSTDQLFSALDDEIAWRRKELTTLILEIGTENREHRLNILLRSAIALGYAHWEGFIKNSTHIYYSYLNHTYQKGSVYSAELKSAYLWSKFRQAALSTNVSDFKNIISFITEKLDEEVLEFQASKLVETKSNLKYERFKEIAARAGIDDSLFVTRSAMINNLVNHRNEIAHGKELLLAKEAVIEHLSDVRELINLYKNSIENKVSLSKH